MLFDLSKGASPNVVNVRIDVSKKKEWWFLLRGDAHHDNVHCDQVLEKQHLDEALERQAGILDCGDLHCAMQGGWDPRKDKSSIRPEHNQSDYLDALVRTAADFYQPYAHNWVMFGHGNHECVDPETEVLTHRGWVKIPEVTMKDRVASMHPHDRTTVWATPVKLHVYPYNGNVYHVDHRGANMMVTPNHRIPYFSQTSGELRYRTAEQIFHLSEAGTCANIPVCAGSGNTSEWFSDDEVRLAAWILSDGSIPKSADCATYIYQSKEEGIEKIKAILDRLGFEYDQTARRDRPLPPGVKTMKQQNVFVVRTRLAYLVGTGKKRVLPGWVQQLSDRQFEVFLQSYIDGDGTRRKEPGQTATAIYGTKAMLDCLQMGCATHGIRSSLSWRSVKTGKGHFVLNVAWKSSLSARAMHPTVVPYDGLVYCLTTGSGNFIMRREGRVCVTGNSAIKKRHETDLTERLAQTLRDRTGAPCPVTGYTGWVRFMLSDGSRKAGVTLWHMHGYGGGGPVTSDTIQAQRQRAYVEGADILWSGHTHDRYVKEDMKITLTKDGEVKHKSLWYVKSGTYKDEYGSGVGGWHIQTGKPPKPLGAWWLKLTYVRTGHGSKVKVLTEVLPTSRR